MLTCEFLCFCATAAMAALGLFVWIREPRSLPRNIFCAAVVLLGLEYALCAVSIQAMEPEAALQWQTLRMAAIGLSTGLWVLFSLTYARGNAREYLRQWKWALALLFVVPPSVATCFHADLFVDVYPVPGGLPEVDLGRAGAFLHVLALLGSVLVLLGLETTLRAATGTMRWRVKFMVLGLGTYHAVRVYTTTQYLLYMTVKPPLLALEAIALLAGSALIAVALWRGRLDSVDIYPPRSLSYRSITIVVTGVYLIFVGVLSRAVTYLGSVASFPVEAFLLFVLLIALAAAALSDRVRQWFRRFASRHLRRPTYDYRKVWMDVAERTASVVDTPSFCRTLTMIVSETFEALSVTLWLKKTDREQLTFGSSTFIDESRAAELVEALRDEETLLNTLAGVEGPMDLDKRADDWAGQLRELTPVKFPGKGGNRLAVPLVCRGELLGLLTLADRVQGLPYSVEEMDLLKTLGDHAAAQLMTMRLSERLLEAKQLEAFQAMSAFFVHDLKNTASTLSLMLENLPKHFDEPSFREDALNAIGRSVTKINDLIGRLSLLRQKLEVIPQTGDLNELARKALDALRPSVSASLTYSPGHVDPAEIDADQLQKVITNIVLNAQDAAGPDGTISVSTGTRGRWVTLDVTDNGCGMSDEYIKHSLFRPFQTTKKQGIGIGLFQSKMIVDAHNGRIEVESREGEGSVFRLLLPRSTAE